MKKITLLALSLSLGSCLIAQLPANNFATYSFSGGSLAETNGGVSFTGTASPVIDRHGDNNNAIDPASIMNGVNLGTNNINNSTLSFWIRSGSTSNERIIQMYGTAGAGYRVQIEDSVLLVNGYAESTSGYMGNIASGTYHLNNNDWQHVAVRTKAVSSNQGVEIELFVNGQPTTTSMILNPPGTGTISIFLRNATLVVNPTNTYNGEIDDIFLYKTDLSDAEILQLYNYTSTTNSLVYVDTDATGNNDGTSWADAYNTIQDGLGSVDAGGEVWVAEGTYYPSYNNDRAQVIAWIKDSIKLYGGFNGTETMLSERDWTVNPTIISGDIGVPGDSTDNSYAVFVGPFDQNGNVLTYGKVDGFTIEHGYADAGTGSFGREGAGVYVGFSEAMLEIKNCIIQKNTATAGAGLSLANTNRDGGIEVINTRFTGNRSRAAAPFDLRSWGGQRTAFFQNCLFDNNEIIDFLGLDGIEGHGGRKMIISGGAVNSQFHNCTWTKNTDNSSSPYKVLMPVYRRFASGSGSVQIFNSVFSDNNHQENNFTFNPITNNAGVIDRIVTNCLIENVTGMVTEDSTNIITGSAQFTDVAGNDFTLSMNSPAIDAGDQSFWPMNGVTTDLAGNDRILDSEIDLGCYEYLTPGGGGSIGIEENTISMTVFPNPTSGKVVIKSDTEIYGVEIFSASGQQVASFETKAFDISSLQSGVYFVKVLSDSGSFTTRIIRE